MAKPSPITTAKLKIMQNKTNPKDKDKTQPNWALFRLGTWEAEDQRKGAAQGQLKDIIYNREQA